MRKTISMLIMLGLLVIMTAGQASALTFNLSQVINGNTSLTPTSSYGTITLSQIGTDVRIDVALADTTHRLQGFALNFNDVKFSVADIFSLNNGTSISVIENGIKSDGYAGFFDIDIPKNGNLGNVSSFSAIIHDSLQNLSVEDFNTHDTLGLLYASAHIGNLNTPSGSIWVGADGPAPVPEPGTMLLLGIGFLGLAIYQKRHQKA